MAKKPSALDVQVGGDHYKSMPIQPIEFITKNKIPFIEGNVIKYICRHEYKNGIQDVEKVIHYCNLLIDLRYPTHKREEERRAAVLGKTPEPSTAEKITEQTYTRDELIKAIELSAERGRVGYDISTTIGAVDSSIEKMRMTKYGLIRS